MNSKEIIKIVLAALVTIAVLVVILVTATILAPAKRSSKAEKVDFECMIEPKANPLKECKNEVEK